ncbi:hypothetical protein MHU86_2787 [Fragilaria crotonensis]|nr:hypothetical protein MHU86_2787 [Fragilaria crotonensis]
MHILGYINHSTPAHLPSSADVDSEFNSPEELEDDVVRIKNPIHPPANGDLSWTTLLHNDTHMQIQFILKESRFLRLQNCGFKWNFHYNNTIHNAVFHLHVPFIVGDTEGHDRLCGHNTARFMEVKQLCRICECPSYLTGYLKSKFPHRLPKKVDSLVQRGLTGELQSMSQNHLKNGFEGVRFGMHNKRGIFGACPGEMLHLILLGWFNYCLQAFSAHAGPKSQALKDYDALCAKLGCNLSRQSYRDVSRTNFSRGYSSDSNLMGHEMAGCLLVKLFALHTTCYCSIFNVGSYKPHFYSPDHRQPTLFLVDVKAISSPLLGAKDIPPFGEQKASMWDWHYLFLIRRKVEWSLAWDAIIEWEHSDLENNVEDDTWFEQNYEKEDVDHVLPGGRVVFGVKTPKDNAKEVAAKKAEKLATKKKKEDEAAAKKCKQAAGRGNVHK